LKECNVIIVTVPTPINENNEPDLSMLKSASKTIADIMQTGTIVIYESTVYPGATEEVCLPILIEGSKLTYNEDFFIGYSPERISPADPIHRFHNINKVVSGSTEEVLEEISRLYKLVIEADLHKASSIRVAEAAKVIENAQRDINVAFVNELSLIFNKMGINTSEVLAAAKTKWNFLDFKPGLVGGHCIGVDPYYLAFKSKELGINPQVILSGRETNNYMAQFIASEVKLFLSQNAIQFADARVGILGLTFKENCPDIRNSKVFDIIEYLKSDNISVLAYDPHALTEDVESEYQFHPSAYNEFKDLDVLVIPVAHNEFKTISPDELIRLMKRNQSSMVFDVKSIFSTQFPGDVVYRSL
jgi:UDP-N-acetyl-D-galactosamine dehydrogenase